jgi:hypothetical protein
MLCETYQAHGALLDPTRAGRRANRRGWHRHAGVRQHGSFARRRPNSIHPAVRDVIAAHS